MFKCKYFYKQGRRSASLIYFRFIIFGPQVDMQMFPYHRIVHHFIGHFQVRTSISKVHYVYEPTFSDFFCLKVQGAFFG